ncbi:MAG: hypothetical protein EOM05_09960 [Clostridia bacterium]|nr:hypothetical protein [Clostridia bacterium]
MDQINELLSSFSAEDMDSLKSLANSLLGSSAGNNNDSENSYDSDSNNEYKSGNSDNAFDSIDPLMIAKIGSIMSMLNSKKDDDRIRLIKALKPMLSEKRKARADEAMKMMSLFELLPELKNLNIL